MKTLDRNDSNDLYLINNGLAIVDGVDAQCILIDSLLNTQVGELQFQPKRGIDYFGTVFLNSQYLELWAREVKTQILKFSWVKRIEDFAYEFDYSTSSVIWSITIVNDDDETFHLHSRKYRKGVTTMTLNLNWDDIKDKPEELEKAINAFVAMGNAARGKEFLSSKSTVGETKQVVNDVILRPLQTNI